MNIFFIQIIWLKNKISVVILVQVILIALATLNYSHDTVWI